MFSLMTRRKNFLLWALLLAALWDGSGKSAFCLTPSEMTLKPVFQRELFPAQPQFRFSKIKSPEPQTETFPIDAWLRASAAFARAA